MVRSVNLKVNKIILLRPINEIVLLLEHGDKQLF